MLDAVLSVLLARVAGLSPHEWLNLTLAALAMLVAFGAVNRMTCDTPRTIKVSFVTVGAGLIGVCLGYFAPDRWQLPFDTVLFGGLLALLVGTRRQTIWLHPRWMPLVSGWCSVLTWVVFLATVRG